MHQLVLNPTGLEQNWLQTTSYIYSIFLTFYGYVGVFEARCANTITQWEYAQRIAFKTGRCPSINFWGRLSPFSGRKTRTGVRRISKGDARSYAINQPSVPAPCSFEQGLADAMLPGQSAPKRSWGSWRTTFQNEFEFRLTTLHYAWSRPLNSW